MEDGDQYFAMVFKIKDVNVQANQEEVEEVKG